MHAHHWVIAPVEEAEDGVLPAACKDCDATRTYPLSSMAFQAGFGNQRVNPPGARPLLPYKSRVLAEDRLQ